MESLEYEKFQDLRHMSQENEVNCVQNCDFDGTKTEDPIMFSDTEMETDQDFTDLNDSLITKASKIASANFSGIITQQLKQSVGNEEPSSDNEFQIKEFNSEKDLANSMKDKGIRSISSRENTSDDENNECLPHQEPVVSWIQCDKPECQKWRKLDIDDISVLSDEKWNCSMNSDPRRNDCYLSQEEWTEDSEDESVYTSFKPGVIVLGKMAGYPWWPGIIEDDPDFDSFFYLDRKPNTEKVNVSYHVTFFGKKVSRAWLSEVSLKKFQGNEAIEDVGPLSYNQKSFSRQVMGALVDGKVALELSLERRIERFGFLSRFKGKRLPAKDRNRGSSSTKRLKSKRHLVEEDFQPDTPPDICSQQYTDGDGDDEDYMGSQSRRTKVPVKRTAHKIRKTVVDDEDDDYIDSPKSKNIKLSVKETARKIKSNSLDDPDDGDCIDKPISKEMKMPGKQTARQIRDNFVEHNASAEEKRIKKLKKKEKREKKENKKLLRIRKKEEKLKKKGLHKEEQVQSDTLIESDLIENQEMSDPCTEHLDESNELDTHDLETTVDTKGIVVDPSVITNSQNQAELMVEKYCDPENVKTFVESLGEMTESFAERIEKESKLKEEVALKKKLREEKKMDMEIKIKKREEKQALLKAKGEKKLIKHNKLGNPGVHEKLVKKKTKKEDNAAKILPNFNSNLKKTKMLQIKDEKDSNHTQNIDKSETTQMIGISTESSDPNNAHTSEDLLEGKLHSQKTNLKEIEQFSEFESKPDKALYDNFKGLDAKWETIKGNKVLLVDADNVNDKNNGNSRGEIDGNDLLHKSDELTSGHQSLGEMQKDISIRNGDDYLVCNIEMRSSLNHDEKEVKMDSDLQANTEKGCELENKINCEKVNSTTKSIFMSALNVEEVTTSPKKSLECESFSNSGTEESVEKLPKLVKPRLPQEAESNTKTKKEMPKLVKPDFNKCGAPKVVPTFSSKKTCKR